MVTARFNVSRVTPMGADNVEDAYAVEVELTPDYAQGRNAEWSEATPSGVCRLTITNKAAIKELPLGSSQEIRFVAVEE
jgi:hypothetical protein